MTYNGWSNYATWRVNLEVIDDWVNNIEDERWESVSDLAKAMEEFADEAITNFGENEEGLAVDYARAFLNDVNWYEIAEHHAEDNNLLESDEDEEEDDEELDEDEGE